MGQVSVYNLSGGNGSDYINDTAAHATDYFAFQCTEETVFAAIAGNMGNAADLCTGEDATALAAGTVIYGRFTSVTLTSGAIIAYKS